MTFEQLLVLAKEPHGHALVAAFLASVIIRSSIQMLKKGESGGLWAKIPAAWRPELVWGLGLGASLLEAVVFKQPLTLSLLTGVGSAAGAMGWQTTVKHHAEVRTPEAPKP